MNLRKNYPLTVMLSSSSPNLAGGPRASVAIGRRAIPVDPTDPILVVEPIFPGCLVSPAMASVDARRDPNATVRFHLTPISEGDLRDARVEIRSRGQTVEVISTPAVVASRAPAKVLSVVAAIAPFIGLESEAQNRLGVTNGIFDAIDPVALSVAVAVLAAVGAALVWLNTRPREAGLNPEA